MEAEPALVRAVVLKVVPAGNEVPSGTGTTRDCRSSCHQIRTIWCSRQLHPWCHAPEGTAPGIPWRCNWLECYLRLRGKDDHEMKSRGCLLDLKLVKSFSERMYILVKYPRQGTAQTRRMDSDNSTNFQAFIFSTFLRELWSYETIHSWLRILDYTNWLIVDGKAVNINLIFLKEASQSHKVFQGL